MPAEFGKVALPESYDAVRQCHFDQSNTEARSEYFKSFFLNIIFVGHFTS